MKLKLPPFCMTLSSFEDPCCSVCFSLYPLYFIITVFSFCWLQGKWQSARGVIIRLSHWLFFDAFSRLNQTLFAYFDLQKRLLSKSWESCGLFYTFSRICVHQILLCPQRQLTVPPRSPCFYWLCCSVFPSASHSCLIGDMRIKHKTF